MDRSVQQLLLPVKTLFYFCDVVVVVVLQLFFLVLPSYKMEVGIQCNCLEIVLLGHPLLSRTSSTCRH
jgi:hypothetical protein